METSFFEKCKVALNVCKINPQTLCSLVANVLAVILEIKQAYLIDQISCTSETVLKFINLVIQESDMVKHCAASKFCILLFDNGEIFFINLNSCIINLSSLITSLVTNEMPQNLNSTIVNVSGSLVHPKTFNSSCQSEQSKILFDCKSILSTLEETQKIISDSKNPKAKTEQNNVGIFKCLFEPGLNLCTAYGILLNYPFVYWFDNKVNSETCLSMIPLVVEKVFIPCNLYSKLKDKSKNRFEIISFSYPECLHSDLNDILQNWKTVIKSKLSLIFLSKYTLKEFSIIVPCIVL